MKLLPKSKICTLEINIILLLLGALGDPSVGYLPKARRDENLLRDFICAQNTGYLTHSEGVHSASSWLIRFFRDKCYNNLV